MGEYRELSWGYVAMMTAHHEGFRVLQIYYYFFHLISPILCLLLL